MTYQSAMNYMKQCEQYGSVLGLKQIRELLRRIGNPQDALPVIHIGGTNGKGSVGTYLNSIFLNAGYHTGRYVSPALFDYREQFLLDGAYVEEQDFADALEQLIPVIERMTEEGYSHPTPFEIETAAAFWIFRKKKCDLVLLEVGMGGKEDATNVVSHPLCSVITSISMDHMAFLGDTIGQIASEKAGIIKKDCPVITYDYRQEKDGEEIESVLRKANCQVQSKKKESHHFFYQADFDQITDIKHHLSHVCFSYRGTDYETVMLGENQPKNAALALETVRVLNGETGDGICGLKRKITKEQCKKGVLDANWPGRFSVVSKEPLIIADGAHNEGAARSLERSIELYLKDYSLIYIMGVFRDKEYGTIARILSRHSDIIYTVTPPSKRGLSSARLAEAVSLYYEQVIDAGGMEHGIKLAEKKAEELEQQSGKKYAIVIFGTLSTLSEVYRVVGLC
ncbi:MAG: bifunctional folylpolyglutamate synthase/dihydrofolate synthase [Clostridiales bacterium]|nr:bifunctional folylpolyglutamate synthase/dihydrofolate synthase [Clostridiales bacterium]